MTAIVARRRAITLTLLATAILALVLLIQAEPAVLWNRLVAEAMVIQRDIHRDLAAAMRAVQARESAAGWTLVSLGFFYGVFHAVGPGHGKVVVATYLATHETRLPRGILLSLLSSLLQGVTAVAAVAISVTVLDRSFREAQGTTAALESASYGLVALLGLFLAVRSGRRLILSRSPHNGHAADERGHHGHACRHGPTVGDLEAASSLRPFVAAVLSIGVRPCSGAILVLVLAYALDIFWAGVAAVFAISAGTAVTVSALAILSVTARRSALALAGAMDTDEVWLRRAIDVVAMLGGLTLILLGAVLLRASIATAQHPLF